LDEKKIDVKTKATDNDGLPLYEWKLDSALGEIQHIKRIPLIDPKKIKKEQDAKNSPEQIAADKKAKEAAIQIAKEAAEKAEVNEFYRKRYANIDYATFDWAKDAAEKEAYYKNKYANKPVI